ncbi:MAG: UDP-N-acetylglucosamine 1-carboxyvinyltransferase, partial [Anaerolineae bacterium]|nr:UDP-N-acetylglucosamine 1-carboxyvinyltransferase [Anaerolineae bacterium]
AAVKIETDGISFAYAGQIHPVDVTTAPHPGFMTDWQPNWAILMTQADGESVLHETVFENRFAYVTELKKLGAKIEFIDPGVKNPQSVYHFNWNKHDMMAQAIRISGRSQLHGAALKILDLRAGASLIVAALLARGESIVDGATTVERGYENVIEKITKLGGSIRKV